MLLARSLLAHIAIQEGAPAKLTFNQYVKWLDDNHYIPPKGKGWVDVIRDMGNEATHDLEIFPQKGATDVLAFVAHLLRNVYEMPGMMPQP